MRWINLDSHFLESVAYKGAELEDKGIWHTLINYCGKIENGGRIKGARLWKSCVWMPVVGLDEDKVHREAPGLWKFIGDDLVLEGYPIDQEKKVKANRLNGKLGGRPSAPNKPHGKPSGKPHGERKRKGKGKGITTIGELASGDDFGLHPDDLDEYGPAPASSTPDPHPRWTDFIDNRETFERFDAYLERTEASGSPAEN